jgi:hypothetical protein
MHASGERPSNHYRPHIFLPDTEYRAGMTEHRKDAAQKPQSPPARMNPDDDDDDESYGFRRGHTLISNRHNEISNRRSDERNEHLKEHCGRHESERHALSTIEHLDLSEWRNVIARVCKPFSRAMEHEMSRPFPEPSVSGGKVARLHSSGGSNAVETY